MSGPIIQTTDLENTLRAIRNQNPSYLSRQDIPYNPDYKSIPNQNYAPTTIVHGAFNKFASATANGGIVYGQPQFFSPVHTPINWQIPSKRLEQYQWARFFYENEPKVASSIDFYSYFPMNDWENECKDRNVKKYYDKLKNRLELPKWTRVMSHEIHKLGDCFPFIEISCENCFPVDTMVLTDNGHKKIQNINVDDIVLTKGGEYFPVIKTMSFKYSGDMVEIKRQSLPSIKSTSDHKHFIVSPEYRTDNRVKRVDWDNPIPVEAKKIKKGDYIAAPFNNVLKSDVKKIIYDGSIYRFKNKHLAKKKDIVLNEGFASLIGWYVAEGSTDSNRAFQFSLNCENEEIIGGKIKEWLEEYFGQGSEVKEFWTRNVRQVVGYSRELSGWFDEHCGHGSVNKKIPYFIMRANRDVKKAFLKAYLEGDGCSRKSRNENTLSTVSKTLCFDLIALLSDLGYSCYIDEKEEEIDNLGIHRCHNYRINYRINQKRENGQGTHKEEFTVFFKVKDIIVQKENTVVYNITVDNDHSYVANYCYTKNCGGSGRLGDEICDHDGGTVRRIVILNPDYVEVFTAPMNPDPVIALKPDEELISMVQKKTPGYERLTPEVRTLVSTGQPIRLDNRNVSHLKYGESGYSRYGVGMIRRLFPILSYKTKLMVAQWIVAERLIVPIKIVKVGSDERPAGAADIAAVQTQLAQTANDPNLTIVTHHAFELDWYGAAGKVLTLSNEFEFINQEVLDGMMINNALLNGEGPNFSAAAVGIEAMVERLETFRREMANWIEEYIYKPEAIRQGFFEKDEDTGEEEPIYPRVKWNSMHLRDQQQYRTFVLQLYEKGLLSAQTVLEAFDFDPDQEIERKRYDAVQMMALGQGMGAQGGEMGGGFSGGGGMPPMPGGGGGGAPGMGGDMMGGEMGGGEMGAAPPIGPPAGGAPALASSTRQISAGPADPGKYGGKILKEKTRAKVDAEQQKIYQQKQKAPEGMPGTGMRDDKGRIVFTGPERELLTQLIEYRKNGLIKYPIIPQFEVQYGSSVFPIDFAIPHLKIGIEADGEVFHSSPKQITHDKERDMKLSQSGWTILRFKDEEISGKIERVMSKVIQNIMQKETLLENQKKLIK